MGAKARIVDYQGQPWRLHELAKHLGIPASTLEQRAANAHPLDQRQRAKLKATERYPERGNATDHPLYNTWQSMRLRCMYPSHKNYKDYGGKGVKVCDRWNESFWNFAYDVGPRPSPQHTLDRYPNKDGDYAPDNIRWATKREQCLNTRVNHLITWNGETLPLAVWADRIGLTYSQMWTRVQNKWPLELMMTAPPGHRLRMGQRGRRLGGSRPK